MKNILDLTHSEAKQYFLREESYFTFDLPKYFNFSELLEKLSVELNEKELSDFYTNGQRPEYFENVNYKLLNNKNGEYSWRLLQLIHPALYVSLVHKITKEQNWKIILNKFQEFQKGNSVECVSLPIVKSEKQLTNKAEQTFTWTEQKSIILGLEYNYIFYTDIVDCYGSIYTHSISWALHTKDNAKKLENRNNNNFIGVVIDRHLQSMTNGQTNGIPEGSILMDFIAEIILGYADQELTKKISEIKKEEYKIIRYRDDYRIFVNNPEIGKKIIKELTNVLSNVGMKLNPGKTYHSNDVIESSIKSDKLYWIENNKRTNRLQEQLLLIKKLSQACPNSGTLSRELQNFYNGIEKRKKIKNINVLISILVNIAFKNPRIYPISSAILSKFTTLLKDTALKKEVISKIKKKFERLPNTEHLDLWLQRITLKIDRNIEYDGKLCKKVTKNGIEIWNSNWIGVNLKNIISSANIIDQKEIEDMDSLITNEEVAIFEQKSYY